MRVLIVEDEKDLANVLSEMLELEGYHTDIANDGEYGLDCAMTGIYDLIILDIMLPKLDGIAVLRKLRQKQISSAVLMLTAKSQIEDKVEGLDSGADDYIAKPFGMMEMVSRVKAVLRRYVKEDKSSELTNGLITMDIARHMVFVNGEEVVLTYKEFEVLHKLMERPGQVFTREQLLTDIWGYDFAGETRTVDVHIRTLRQKLGSASTVIETVRGVGYRIGAEHEK